MQYEKLKKIKLPDSPGVYFFRKGREILYIGKATSLRDRVRSYFGNELISTRGSRIVDMVTQSTKLDFQKTDSVLEALILESNLIKQHSPKYNVKEKDDKSYNSVIVTDEKFPRVLLIRNHEVKHNLGLFKDLSDRGVKIKKIFGPFPNSGQLREAMRLIQKIFPFFDTKKSVSEFNASDLKRIKLNIQIGIYPDVFSLKVTEKEYDRTIKNIILFFEGRKNQVLKNLKKQMSEFSKNKEYEKAAETKKTIFAINHIKDVSLIKNDNENDISSGNEKTFRIESYDVAHLSGDSAVGAMCVMEDGELNKGEYKKFVIKQASRADDLASLKEIVERRLAHDEWRHPDMILIDGGKNQLNSITKIVKKIYEDTIVLSIVKDEHHKAREILGISQIPKEIINKEFERKLVLLNQETHRFAISFFRKRFHKQKTKMLK